MGKIPDEFRMNLFNVDIDLRTILGSVTCDVNMCDTPLSEEEKTELVEHLQAASKIAILGLHRKMRDKMGKGEDDE
jgi:hypothetical protein